MADKPTHHYGRLGERLGDSLGERDSHSNTFTITGGRLLSSVGDSLPVLSREGFEVPSPLQLSPPKLGSRAKTVPFIGLLLASMAGGLLLRRKEGVTNA